MKSIGSLCIRGVGAAVTMAAVAFCSLNARAEIVFGNLGATGTTAISTTTTDLGQQKPNDVNWLAQGFNTGASSNLIVDSVTIGVFGSSAGTVPLTVSIFSGSGNVPGTALYTSAATNVGLENKYTFAFTGAVLQPNTDYYVVPNGGSWYWNTGSPAAPEGQNSSGYTYTRTVESQAQTTTPAGPWVDPASSNRYSVTLTAVPEPSTVGLAGVGILGVAVMKRRRKVMTKSADAGHVRR